MYYLSKLDRIQLHPIPYTYISSHYYNGVQSHFPYQHRLTRYHIQNNVLSCMLRSRHALGEYSPCIYFNHKNDAHISLK